MHAYGGTSNDQARSVVETSDGGYAIAGNTRSLSAGEIDFWLVKTNSTGHMEWNQTYGGASRDFGLSACIEMCVRYKDLKILALLG